MAGFSGHHVKEYDWRDDSNKNDNLYEDPRGKGWNYTEYSTPYTGPADKWYRINVGSSTSLRTTTIAI